MRYVLRQLPGYTVAFAGCFLLQCYALTCMGLHALTLGQYTLTMLIAAATGLGSLILLAVCSA